MKSGKYIIAIIVIGVAGFFIWNTFFKALEPQRNIQTVVAFGDSLIEGVGATEGNDFVSLLSKRTGKKIINAGTSGETTEQGLARIDEILDMKPDLVLVLFGGNDALRRISKQQTFQNLDSMLTIFKANNVEVVLLGIQGGPLADPYKSEFDALAKKHKVIYVPNVLEGLFAHPELMADAVHPNDAGYKKMADRVYDAIESRFRVR
jgi:lysophospholipase L1-like esterase